MTLLLFCVFNDISLSSELEVFEYSLRPREELHYVLSAEGEASLSKNIEDVSRSSGVLETPEIHSRRIDRGGSASSRESDDSFDFSIFMQLTLKATDTVTDLEVAADIYTDLYAMKWNGVELYNYDRAKDDSRDKDIFGNPFQIQFKPNLRISSIETPYKNADISDRQKLGIFDMEGITIDDISPLLLFLSYSKYVKVAQEDLNPHSLLSFLYPKLPDSKLKAGDTWRGEIQMLSPFSILNAPSTIDVEFTFEGYDIYNDVECAKISVRFEKDIGRSIEKAEDYKHTSGAFIYEDVASARSNFDVKQYNVEVENEIYFDVDNGTIVAVDFSIYHDLTATEESSRESTHGLYDNDFADVHLSEISETSVTTNYFLSFMIQGTYKLE